MLRRPSLSSSSQKYRVNLNHIWYVASVGYEDEKQKSIPRGNNFWVKGKIDVFLLKSSLSTPEHRSDKMSI